MSLHRLQAGDRRGARSPPQLALQLVEQRCLGHPSTLGAPGLLLGGRMLTERGVLRASVQPHRRFSMRSRVCWLRGNRAPDVRPNPSVVRPNPSRFVGDHPLRLYATLLKQPSGARASQTIVLQAHFSPDFVHILSRPGSGRSGRSRARLDEFWANISRHRPNLVQRGQDLGTKLRPKLSRDRRDFDEIALHRREWAAAHDVSTQWCDETCRTPRLAWHASVYRERDPADPASALPQCADAEDLGRFRFRLGLLVAVPPADQAGGGRPV